MQLEEKFITNTDKADQYIAWIYTASLFWKSDSTEFASQKSLKKKNL